MKSSVRAAGAVERLDVGGELDQVARYEARRQAHVAQNLHQQPARVAARTAAYLQRFLRRLHPRLHADQIGDVALQAPIQIDQKILRNQVGLQLVPLHVRQPLGETLTGGLGREVGRQLVLELGGIFKWKLVGVFLDEEIERVDHRHVGDQIDRDGKLPRRFGKNKASDVIAVGILLPIDEVLCRQHGERIGKDRRARMGRRPQPHLMRRQYDGAIVAIAGQVVQRNSDGHRSAPRATGLHCGNRICRRNNRLDVWGRNAHCNLHFLVQAVVGSHCSTMVRRTGSPVWSATMAVRAPGRIVMHATYQRSASFIPVGAPSVPEGRGNCVKFGKVLAVTVLRRPRLRRSR